MPEEHGPAEGAGSVKEEVSMRGKVQRLLHLIGLHFGQPCEVCGSYWHVY